MQKQRVKTSMSVPEMGKMLGLGKVESYWLVKKNYFKTIQVAGRMRVMLDSFEDWYAGQFHYKKVDGTPPGEKWRHTTMSVPEMADLLGLKSGTAYDLVKRGYFETTLIDRRIRIITSSFEALAGFRVAAFDVGLDLVFEGALTRRIGLYEVAAALVDHQQVVVFVENIVGREHLRA